MGRGTNIICLNKKSVSVSGHLSFVWTPIEMILNVQVQTKESLECDVYHDHVEVKSHYS